ncbi:MAG: hypothetical protein H6868_01240 [Rhodospirillales bacterium]|nr:hypothetical protein [Rhodospirillales bacterium]
MQATKKELMDRLGVGYVLGPYENCPWLVYDGEKGVTCSAEVRMGMDDSDGVEAAIEMIYEMPDAGQPPAEHTFLLQARNTNSGNWTISKVWIRGEPIDETISGWPEKACNFFAAVVQSLKQDEVPDIDDLLEQELRGGRGADQYGGGGGKSPKIQANKLLNPRGRGF